MKNVHAPKIWLFGLCALAALAAARPAAAQGTAFTYSGRLTGNGAVLTGNYDMRFTLYDAENGNPVAGPLVKSPVAVENGLFTLRIDFGPGVFTGAARWLGIEVRPIGAANYTALTPRYEVTSSPYAIRSQSSAAADTGGGGGGGWAVTGGNAYYDAGSVSIGTNSATPGVRLEVSGAARVSPGGSGGFLQLGTPNGETGLSVIGANRADLRFDGSTLKLVAGAGPGVPAGSSGLAITTSGRVGLGTTSPAGRLHLYEAGGSVTQRIETGGGVNAWTRLEFLNGNGRWNVGTSRGFLDDEFFIHREGSSAIAFAVKPNGDAFVDGRLTTKVLTITGGADIAEPFPMDPGIEKGSVMVIDPDRPGTLRLSSEPYDRRVAGIVSGANGIRPGIALQQAGALDQGDHVALSGRVYALADADYGPIVPGDLLASSATPGHAMKATDPSRAQGAVLGKAMSPLAKGRGHVLVLVTLQ